MLDKVLEWFAMIDIDEMGKGEQIHLRESVFKDDAIKLIQNKFSELKTLEFALYENLIFDKLVRDTYLKEIGDRHYSITFEGKLFNEQGGYGQRIKTDTLNAKNLEIDVATRKRNEKLIVVGTWAVAFGAVALVIWEIYKHYCLHVD
jgi:hypothetical protein